MFSSYYMDAHGHVYPNQVNQDDVRVVVISPEDREQVERLNRLQDEAYDRAAVDVIEQEMDVTIMQAALREFANPTPPKPEEPTGLGAVVEDVEGRRYVRSERHEDAPWDKFREYVGGFLWSDIKAVRVLSEGVVPS